MSRETNDGTLTREPPLRISQILLEPALLEVIRQNPLIDARFGWTVQSFEQDEDSVRVAISETDGTATETIECRSEEHTSELQSLMRISYAVFCLKKKKTRQQ